MSSEREFEKIVPLPSMVLIPTQGYVLRAMAVNARRSLKLTGCLPGDKREEGSYLALV